jgi:signal transduction histidine kinase
MKLLERLKKRLFYEMPEEFAELYRTYIGIQIKTQLNIIFLFCIFLVPLGGFFDVLVYPGQWKTLVLVRLLSMLACTLLYFVFNHTILNNYPYVTALLLDLIVPSQIAYLCYLTGGYASPYYVGFILLFIGIAMILPWSIFYSIITSLIILFIHFSMNLLPWVILGKEISWPIFWNSIYFLTFSFAMVVAATGILENSRQQIFVATEQEKIRNKILEESRLKIDALLKTKSRFISNITHELKTPLSIVIGNTDIILEKAEFIDEAIANQLRVIQQAAFQLAAHVDRIIAVSTADDPELKMNTDRYDYVGIIRNVFKLFEPKAREEGIQFSLNLPLQSLVVDIDVVRIEEVLNNLIQNAFKFTEGGGGITVTVSTDGQTVFTEVSDTGVGIPENQHNEIFERLYQADEVLSKRHGGIGIGLYLCKRNIELHGGTITVHSRVGKGSSFKFSIPLFVNQSTEVRNKPYAGPEQRAVPERRTGVDRRMVERQKRFEYQQTLGIDDLAKMTYVDDISDYENRSPALPSVLIVEDNPRMMKVIAESLGDEYNLFLAMNGLEALNKLEMNTGHISLILSDVMMPGMSGFDFCKTVMAREEWKGIPVIFVTALLKEEDQLRGFELGATDYIIKPYNIKILREKVTHWISRRQYELLLQDMSASLESRVKEISRIKDIILHEIRNPLQLIGGADFFLQRMSNTLFKSSGEEERRWKKSLKMLTQGIESIKSVLETSQSLEEMGLSSKKPEPVSTLFDDAISQCAHLMNNIKLHVDLKVMADRIVLCNKKMMTQVFVNLIRNATEAIRERAPEDGGVIRITSAKEDEASVIFKIRDNGSGITPEAKEQLFRFRFTTKKDGMGVGLHLSKIILKMHEGNITVESEEKVGTTFLISLPLYNP